MIAPDAPIEKPIGTRNRAEAARCKAQPVIHVEGARLARCGCPHSKESKMTIRTVATLAAAMMASTLAISSAVAHEHGAMGASGMMGSMGSMDASGMMAKMDTNHDGNISAAEHAAYAQAMFDKMDANHDGMLSKDEIKSGMKAMHEEHEESSDMDEQEGHEKH